MMEKQKIKVTGLRNALRRFEYNGRYAQSGDWTIANGGYDLQWQICYCNMPVLECCAGELSLCCSPYIFTKQDIAKLVKVVCDEYKGVRLSQHLVINLR